MKIINLTDFISFFTKKFHPKGTRRILNLLFDPIKFHIKKTVKYDGDLLFNLDTSSRVDWNIYFFGYYSKNEIGLIKKTFKDGFVSFDVGANIGTHTLIMSKASKKNGRVLAFEPHPGIRQKLENNINLNNINNIKIFQAALSDKPGKMTLYSFDENVSDKGTSSLYPKDYLTEKFEIEVSTIDEIAKKENLKRLDFIKIDTRGSDFPAILGATESIKKFKPAILFEYNKGAWTDAGHKWEDVWNFFKQNNYQLALLKQNGNLPLLNGEPEKPTSHNILATPALA